MDVITLATSRGLYGLRMALLLMLGEQVMGERGVVGLGLEDAVERVEWNNGVDVNSVSKSGHLLFC